MIHAAIRDLLYRRRRYLISMIGAALVFAMSLVMTGLSAAFPAEWERTNHMLGAAAYVVPAELSGPFTGGRPFEAERLPAGAEPMTYAVQTVTGAKAVTVGMFGVRRGASTEPRATSGSQLHRPLDLLASDRAPFGVGDTVVLAGKQFKVVGRIGQQSTNSGHAIRRTSPQSSSGTPVRSSLRGRYRSCLRRRHRVRAGGSSSLGSSLVRRSDTSSATRRVERLRALALDFCSGSSVGLLWP